MKKLIAILTVSLLVGAVSLQAQDGKYMHSEIYKLTFSEEVMIQIGAAKENRSTSDWEKGSKVGKYDIDPALFEEMQKSTSGDYKIEIEKKKIGTLHGMQVTNLETGKVLKGIYNEKDIKFTFGAAKTSQQNGASRTDIGIIVGQLSDDKKSIQNGEFGIGFVVGKSAQLLSARAVFYFTAQVAKK